MKKNSNQEFLNKEEVNEMIESALEDIIEDQP